MFIIAANWKMNGNAKFATEYSTALSSINTVNEIVIIPPFPLLSLVKGSFKLGAQNCHTAEKGAFTGEVSATILKDIGCDYVICGHSERREMGESSVTVAAKAASAHKAGLKTIICIGEKEGEDFSQVVFSQLAASIPPCATPENTVLAYEPVWAIGTGKTPTSADIERCHSQIKAKYNFAVMYGGSVNAGNAEEISAIKNVDGLLVGGASLDIESFKSLITRITK